MEPSLSDDLHSRITALCQQGDGLLDQGDNEGALAKYSEAWAIVPDPKHDWEAATWVLSAIGDVHYYQRRFDQAWRAFADALKCPNGIGNPFIHLRIGEAAFELGDLDRAKQELALAYMGAGREIFENEDPKYFALLKSVLEPPVGQDSL